jgi:hypothetical protein
VGADALPHFAVLVTGGSEAELRRFLARSVKLGLGMRRSQWHVRYRGCYPLVVLSRPLRPGEDPQSLYGRHAGACVLIVAALSGGRRGGAGREATRDWLAAQGFDPRVELALGPAESQSQRIDQGIVVVNYVNSLCPWRTEGIADIDAYLAKNNRPFWA